MNIILTIIVAAGSGLRMGSALPKQFLSIDGEPIVMRTLRRMSEGVERLLADWSHNGDNALGDPLNVNNIVHKLALILPKEHIELWNELCRESDFRLPHIVIEGGNTRFESVKRGLTADPTADIILVHDGVRPFADDAVIGEVIRQAQAYGAAIPVTPVVDSMRRLTGEGSVAVSRDEYRSVQTPQGFKGDILRQAYNVDYDPRFTDDASVVEALNSVHIRLTQGSSSNIKITTPTDIIIAESMVRNAILS